MSENKIETIKGLCVVNITKFIMTKLGLSADEGYAKFMQMEMFDLLMDTDSGMYLEQNEFLIACCEKEIDYGAEELYKFLEVA